MKGPLYLTRYNTKEPVFVTGKIVDALALYQVDGVRFIYQQCILKNQNIILNNEPGMNEERQICAFLTAIEKSVPSLIVCQRHYLSKWYYEFTQADLKVVTADELMKDDSWEQRDLPDAVLLYHDQLKHIKALPFLAWFFFIVQNLENLEKSRYIKKVDAQYRIGLVNQNYSHLTSELQWFAMNWANSSLVEEKDKFVKADHFKKSNFLWPFPDYWKRITWENIKKPTPEQFEEYEETVKNWCRDNNPSILSNSAPEKQKPTRKRVPATKQMKKKKSRVMPKQTKKEELSSDEDTEEIISNKPTRTRTIQSSSSNDDDTLDYTIEESPSPVKKRDSSPGNNYLKLNMVTPPKRNIVKNLNFESSPTLSDDSKESCILDSLFDSPEPSTSKCETIKIKIKNEKLKNVNIDEDDNFILDSLMDSPEPLKKQKDEEIRKLDIKIKDDEIDSCPILDLLF